MNYSNLRTQILASMKYPPKITAQALQEQLINIVNGLDLGALLLGVATPSLTPNTEANGFYFGLQPGTYTNFPTINGETITVDSSEVAIIVRSGNYWSKIHITTYPSIDPTTKHWMIGGEDTGVVAEGTDGVTPHIDSETGNWFIGTTNTGIHAQGAPGQDAYQPFKGTFASVSDLNTAFPEPNDGDTAYVEDTVENTTVLKVYDVVNGEWHDTGTTADSPVFGSGQFLSSVKIDDTHIANPADGSLPKSEDVMQLKAKLEGVTASEVKVTPIEDWHPEGSSSGYYNTSKVWTTNSNFVSTRISIYGYKKVRFIGYNKSFTAKYAYGFLDADSQPIGDFIEYYNAAIQTEGKCELEVEVPADAAYFVCLRQAWSTNSEYQMFQSSDFYCYLIKGDNVMEAILQTEKTLTNKIIPIIVSYDRAEVANKFKIVSQNRFPVCQYQSQSASSPAYYGLFKNYAIGKTWQTLLEENENTNHRTYMIPVDPERYVMCSIRIYGSDQSSKNTPLACLVDENDIVVACITNNFGNGGYWTGNIIPVSAKYLIMPYYVSESYIVSVSFVPRVTYVSQNDVKVYPYCHSQPQDFNVFGSDNPIFGGGYVLDSVVFYGRIGNLGKFTVDDLLASFYGSSNSKQIFKLFYVEGYDEVDFCSLNSYAYSGFFFVIDREGKIIDVINNFSYYFNNYQLPSEACFMALRGSDTIYERSQTIKFRKKSLMPLKQPLQPLSGISFSKGKLGENGELNNLSGNSLYWTSSFIDLSKGFTLTLNSDFVITKAVLYKTDATVVNPYFIEESYNAGDFWSIANQMPGYMIRITVGLKNQSSESEPITSYDSIVKFFTYLDNSELGRVIPQNLPYDKFKKRFCKLTNISEIARYDQWMDHFDNWNNNSQSIPMSSNDGEPRYWNSRFREGWTEFGIPYSETSEYGYYVGQNISLKTYITAVQNKRSVMYFERINGSIVNSSTIGSKISKYNYSYNGLNSRYAASFYGTVCTGLTGYVMGLRNIYVSDDYMKRNAGNNGSRVPNLSVGYAKYYADTITQQQWDEMIDWLQPMDFIWTPGHCSVVSDIYKDSSGKTQLIVWTEQLRPFTKSRAYTREKFQERLNGYIESGDGGFGLLRYEDWGNAEFEDYFDDDRFFSVNNWSFKSNIKIDPDITTFRGEYVTFQIKKDVNDTLNDYAAFLNIHRGRVLYDTLQIFSEDDTQLSSPIKTIAIDDNTVYPSDTLYDEDSYDKEDWIIFDMADSEKMGGNLLEAGRYKARLYNSSNEKASGFTHFEFVDFVFSAQLDGNAMKASWSDFSENATPYLIRQERITGMALTEGSGYPSSPEARQGQTYIFNVDNQEGANETIFTLTDDSTWGSSYYTKIYVRGTYGTVCRRIKTVN